ncbi:hypothetical protein MES5069_1070014 [Mesorhizobium escarrei]|uniref:Uncharacterized protein n=1 Tax=Mesorhizobium escarrei TaxID=666018 RepID=A0ABN8JHK8_9HYPH|nr:hypothetical protein MES5069_1070014 [Mesorhizobium escarrei]
MLNVLVEAVDITPSGITADRAIRSARALGDQERGPLHAPANAAID